MSNSKALGSSIVQVPAMSSSRNNRGFVAAGGREQSLGVSKWAIGGAHAVSGGVAEDLVVLSCDDKNWTTIV